MCTKDPIVLPWVLLFLGASTNMKMQKVDIEGSIFQRLSYSATPLAKGDYDNCRFENCDFSHGDLSNINFTDCSFLGCNLSLVKLSNTGLKSVKFIDCKILGAHFHTCSDFLFAVDFERCTLDQSTFYKRKMKKTRFKNCSMHGVDLTGTDLSGASFDNCDLLNATFSSTVLEKADLTTSYNFTIDPETNRIKKARFSLNSLPNLLSKYDIEIV
jgi:fluoroquinolone resistance protein